MIKYNKVIGFDDLLLYFQNTYRPSIISQAPAALIYGDKNAFYECGFIGVQDTLTDFIGRHLFEGCYIEGYVDFIWGYGQSVYHVSPLSRRSYILL